MNTNADDYLFTASVEDNIYMVWQLELMVHSLSQQCMKRKVDNCIIKPENICAIVHSNKPALSKYFMSIVNKYGIKYIKTRNFGRDHVSSFFRRGETLVKNYVNKNKTCCYGAVFSEGLHEEYKYTILSDPDVYAYEYFDVQKFPTRRTAIAEHWLTDHPVIDHFPNSQFDEKGIDLMMLMKAMGVHKRQIESYVPGSCLIFLKKEDFSKELVNAMPGYNDILRGVCQVTKQDDDWCVEMPSYSLAFAHCGVKTDLLHEPEFAHETSYGDINGEKVKPGCLIHYGYESCWQGTGFNKWQYTHKNPFENKAILEAGIDTAAHEVGRHFFVQALDVAKSKDMDRSMDPDKTTAIKLVFDLNELCPISKPPTKKSMLPLDDYEEVYSSFKTYLETTENRPLKVINTEEVTYVVECDILVTQSLVRMKHEFLELSPWVIRFNIIDSGDPDHIEAEELLRNHGYNVFVKKEYVIAVHEELVNRFLDLVF